MSIKRNFYSEFYLVERDDLMLRNAELSQELRTVKKSLEDEKSALEEDIKTRIEAENVLRQNCDQLQNTCDTMRQEVISTDYAQTNRVNVPFGKYWQ